RKDGGDSNLKKTNIMILLLAAVLIATGCSKSENPEKEVKAKNTEKQDEKAEEMYAKEVEEIVKENLTKIEDVMEEISNNHQEVFEEWFNIIDNTVVANEEAKQQISTNQNIQEFVTEKGLEEMIIPYLSVYLRDTDRWGIITEEDIGVRFQVLEQTEKSFKASTIRLATFAEYDPSETVVLDYVQEDGNWKFNL